MKTYLIAGGTLGIGKATADMLVKQGHRVIALSRNTVQDSAFEHICWDALSNDFPQLNVEALDGVVYAPGSINLKPFHRLSETEFLNDWQVNFMGAVKLLQHVLPLLKKSTSPSVVLFSTVAVQTGMPFHASIAAAKGAVEGLTRSLAAEWAPLIRVNAVAPSLTDTRLAEKLLSTPEKREASAKRHPLNRVAAAEDIASLTSYLLSEESRFITGQIFQADGGMSALRILS
jgi:3-oxoacyl-[acyl-carrier protein] reductase